MGTICQLSRGVTVQRNGVWAVKGKAYENWSSDKCITLAVGWAQDLNLYHISEDSVSNGTTGSLYKRVEHRWST